MPSEHGKDRTQSGRCVPGRLRSPTPKPGGVRWGAPGLVTTHARVTPYGHSRIFLSESTRDRRSALKIHATAWCGVCAAVLPHRRGREPEAPSNRGPHAGRTPLRAPAGSHFDVGAPNGTAFPQALFWPHPGRAKGERNHHGFGGPFRRTAVTALVARLRPRTGGGTCRSQIGYPMASHAASCRSRAGPVLPITRRQIWHFLCSICIRFRPISADFRCRCFAWCALHSTPISTWRQAMARKARY
jgi:hypothetical protein